MRKKIKPKRDGTPSFSDDDSHPGKHQQSSQSPGGHAGSRDRPGQAGFDRGSGGQNRYSKAIEVEKNEAILIYNICIYYFDI